MCILIVPLAVPNRAAISLFARPSATSVSTSASPGQGIVLREVFAQPLGYLGGQQPLAAMDQPHGVEHFGVHHFLQQVAPHAGFERAIDVLIAVEAGQRNDLGRGKFGPDLLHGRNAVELRHPQVHQRDVGLVAAGRVRPRRVPCRLRRPVRYRLRCPESKRCPWHQRMVVDAEHANLRGVGLALMAVVTDEKWPNWEGGSSGDQSDPAVSPAGCGGKAGCGLEPPSGKSRSIVVPSPGADRSRSRLHLIRALRIPIRP